MYFTLLFSVTISNTEMLSGISFLKIREADFCERKNLGRTLERNLLWFFKLRPTPVPDSRINFNIELSHSQAGCIRKAHNFSPTTPLTLILLKPSPLCDHDQVVITYSWGDGNNDSAQVELQITQSSEITEKPNPGNWKEFSDIAKNLENMAERMRQKRFKTVKLEVPENGRLSGVGEEMKKKLDLEYENSELTHSGRESEK